MYFSDEMTAAPTKLFATGVSKRRQMGKNILSFGLGEPDFKTPDYIIDEMNKAISDGYTHYCNAQGLEELRELIAKQTTKDYGVCFDKNEVAIVPGIKSAVYSALAAILEPNDKVGLVVPCYVAYPAMIKMAEPTANIIEIDMNNDFSFNIKKIIDTIDLGIKCLIINSPNNPTGAIINKDEMDIIVEHCIKKNVYILSDEVYDKIVFSNYRHHSFAEYESIKKLLILANGYSKSHAMTGWRLGYAIAPKEICYRISRIQFNTNTNTTTFIQKAACSIYSHDQNHIIEYTKELENRINYFPSQVNQINKLSGIAPKGGFFYFLDISKTGLSSNEFCYKLVIDTGIATTPGIAFGKNWDNYVRFSLAVPIEQIKQATVLLKKFMEEL